ncbi:MAG: endoribonuclease MazF [Actinobacteria bacterium]|nr:endoribonuclease MazF [Actinomycetota bacterium]
MVDNYVPARGDIAWISLNPQKGHEQTGRRPALVLSPYSYNRKTGLAIFCPITSVIKGYPFEVQIGQNYPVNGVILADQVKSLDWRIRIAEYICRLDSLTLNIVLEKLKLLTS